MKERRATCACEKLAVVARGEPVRVSICHCLECQKRTGSVFGAQARFARENVTFSGTATTFARKGDSGGVIAFSFCASCGSTLYWELDGLPGFVVVALGAFADPGFPSPKVSIYEARRHAWTDMPGLAAEHLD